MSNLHKIKVSHAKMTDVEKEHCECELCKNSNVGKLKRKNSSSKPDKTMEDIMKDMNMSVAS